MGITLKKASKVLGMSEEEVLQLVSATKLKSERRGKRVRIDEASLEAVLQTELDVSGNETAHRRCSPDIPKRSVIESIEGIRKELSEKFDLLEENRKLLEELRRKDRTLALKDTEIEKLKAELVYQKRLLEKEIEYRARALDERMERIDREISERVLREREKLERILEIERSALSDRLSIEQEKLAAKSAELQTRQGFWSRLIRMLTWS